jgi:hypothetical protein
MHTLRPHPALPLMPIAIDNGLPHITFSLGSDPALLDLTLRGLMDTCGALNTGYLLFHLWLMSERPDLVAEFILFDDSNPFEPIKFGGAIRDPSDFDAADHGNLTAVIRYYTLYTNVSGSPITLSFGLGSDVTVNAIFGLPMLCALDSIISLNSNSLHSRSLNTEFLITRAAATFGLPPDCSFDPTTSSCHHDSLHGLHPSDAPLHSITPVPLQLATTPLVASFNAPFIPPSDITVLPRSFLFQFLPHPACLSPFPIPSPSVLSLSFYCLPRPSFLPLMPLSLMVLPSCGETQTCQSLRPYGLQ